MLLAKLAEIKNARLLGPQADEALDPFIGKPFSLSLTFVSASRTFGHRFDAAYDDGQTLICKLGDEGLEASVLLVPEESDLVDSLVPDEAFEARLTVLDFDALYQRPVLGQYLGDIPVQEEEEAEPEQLEETPTVEYHEAVEVTESEDTVQVEPEPEPELVEEPIETRDPAPSAVGAMLDDLGKANRRRGKRSTGECPNGHGPLKSWEGKMVCWTCGWPNAKKPTRKRSLQQTRSRQQPRPGQRSQAKPPEEKKGCNQGCRFAMGGFVLLMSLISCSNGGVGFGFVTFLIGLGCFWPIIKKKIDEQQS